MATWTDVARILRPLTGVEADDGKRTWRVKGKLLAWERPLRKADLEELGAAAPRGDILGVHVTLDVKDLLLDAEPSVYFTTSHFDGYPAVLLRLAKIRAPALRALLEDAWRERAPKKLVASSAMARRRR
jgi:hypothetical protein